VNKSYTVLIIPEEPDCQGSRTILGEKNTFANPPEASRLPSVPSLPSLYLGPSGTSLEMQHLHTWESRDLAPALAVAASPGLELPSVRRGGPPCFNCP
jgi:hypothetical protein